MVPAVSYSRVDGIPWVRSGSSERGICVSGVWSAGGSAGGSDGFAGCESVGSGDLGDSEEAGLCGVEGVDDGEVFDGPLNLEGGLLFLAIPLLHIVGTVARVGNTRGAEDEVAHLETTAGWARRKAALGSMTANVSAGTNGVY